MDPHNHPGQPVLPPDSSTGEEGVNYLRRLRGGVAGGASADTVATATADESQTDATSPRALLNEIELFFQKNLMLSRQGFNQIAKRLRRS